MKNVFCALALSLAVGCTTAVVRPYVGAQQAWPTSAGTIVNIRYDMPIFTSLPPSPYAVLAELRVDSPLYAQPEERHMGILTKAGRQIGAEALVLVDGQTFFGSIYSANTNLAPTATLGGAAALTQVNKFNPESFKQGVNVLAIKWTQGPPPGLGYKNAIAPAVEKPAPKAKKETKKPAPAPTPVVTPVTKREPVPHETPLGPTFGN